ncbi:MAG: isoprenylcysteine carboxylmethyltransferase family protein [Terriglobales bacterium]
MPDSLFHSLFVALFAALLVLRIYYHRQGQTWKRFSNHREGWFIIGLRLFVGLPMMIAAVVYMVRPSLMPWAVVPMPDKWRWIGFGMGLVGLALGTWVHRTLGKNFSSELRIRPDHELVVAGPYRWVRHPMYTSFVVLMTGLFLLSGNWLICGTGLAVLFFVMLFRTPREEKMMEGRFGEQYRAYMATTGRYLPRL